MPQFYRESIGRDVVGQKRAATKISERSTIRLREDEERRRIAQEDRQLEQQELSRARAEEDAQNAYVKQLESASDELGLNVPYKRTTTRVTAPPFSPLAERIQAEQGYQRLSTPDKIRYLEDRVKPAVQERGRTQLSEEASAYGVTEEELSKFTTAKGRQALIESKKKAFAIDQKARIDDTKEKEKTRNLIKWISNNQGKTYTFEGTPYTLDTASEAKRVLSANRKRALTTAEENEIDSFGWPAGGVDELGERTEEQEIEYQRELAEAKRKPEETPEARLQRIEEESRVRGKVGQEFEKLKESPDIAEKRRLQSAAVKAGLGDLEGETLADVRKSYENKLNKLDNEAYTDALIKEILEDKKMWKRFKKNEQLFKDNGANVESIKKTIKARKGW